MLIPFTEVEASAALDTEEKQEKRGRGRPKGSKNKPREGASSSAHDGAKRKRGRPPKVTCSCRVFAIYRPTTRRANLALPGSMTRAMTSSTPLPKDPAGGPARTRHQQRRRRREPRLNLLLSLSLTPNRATTSRPKAHLPRSVAVPPKPLEGVSL